MSLLNDAALAQIPRHVLDWVHKDDWDRVVRSPATPAAQALVAVLCMENGYFEGVRQLLHSGLSPTCRIPVAQLRDRKYGAASVSLLRVAAELAHSHYRDPSVAPLLQLLLDAGASALPEELGVVMKLDDCAATKCLLIHDPSLLSTLGSRADTCIRSPEMLELLLDHGLSDHRVAGWLWSVDMEERYATQVPAMIAVLAAKGFDLDTPKPVVGDPPVTGRSVLEYHLQAPLLADDFEHPFLVALIEHGARLDNLPLADLQNAIPALSKPLADRQAGQLNDTTPVVHDVRPRRF